MKSLSSKYIRYVRGVILPNGVSPSKEISYWRNEIFCNILTYVAPASLIALIPCVYISFAGKIPVVGIADLIAFSLVIVIMVRRKLPLAVRKRIFIYVVYLLSVILLYYINMSAPGMLLLLTLTILTSIIYSPSAAYYSAWANTGICLVFGILIFARIDAPFVKEYTLGTWIAVSTNLVLFGFVSAKCLNLLLRGLETSMNEQKAMESTQLKRLEKLVAERTLELKQALHEEKNLVERKNQFISIASHEFRTPLSTISFAAESIRNYFHQLTPDEIQRKLIKIGDQAAHMNGLLEDILTLGKSEAGKTKMNRVRLDPKEFITSLIDEVRATVKQLRKINFTFSGRNGNINVDDKLLRNVINNLLTNALKFSDAATEVNIAVTDSAGDLLIEVSDEGMGIEENELTSIFESFQRGSNATAVQGTGLGLSILKKAVDIMEGSIEVKSILHVGSTFAIRIPLPT